MIDDQRVNRLLLKAYLRKLGLAAVSASSLEQAWQRLEADWPRWILLDAHLPHEDPLVFIRKVRQLRPNNRVLLYCNRHYWLNVDTTSYAGDGLWIADYVTAGKPRIKAKWRFHQYTDDPVDKDVADFASKAALREWAADA